MYCSAVLRLNLKPGDFTSLCTLAFNHHGTHANKFHLSNYPTDFNKCGGKIPIKNTVVTRLCMVLPGIRGSSVWILLPITLMAPRTQRRLLYSYKICAPLTLGEYIFGSYCYSKNMVTIQRLDTDILHFLFTGIYRICYSQDLPEKHAVL